MLAAAGLLDIYDAPHSLPAIAPRPLLAVQGELDPRCPLEGLRPALDAARAAYQVRLFSCALLLIAVQALLGRRVIADQLW